MVMVGMGDDGVIDEVGVEVFLDVSGEVGGRVADLFGQTTASVSRGQSRRGEGQSLTSARDPELTWGETDSDFRMGAACSHCSDVLDG